MQFRRRQLAHCSDRLSFSIAKNKGFPTFLISPHFLFSVTSPSYRTSPLAYFLKNRGVPSFSKKRILQYYIYNQTYFMCYPKSVTPDSKTCYKVAIRQAVVLTPHRHVRVSDTCLRRAVDSHLQALPPPQRCPRGRTPKRPPVFAHPYPSLLVTFGGRDCLATVAVI